MQRCGKTKEPMQPELLCGCASGALTTSFRKIAGFPTLGL
jgi:hypothetical protein